MMMWIIIMWVSMAFVAACLFYLGVKVPDLFDISAINELSKMNRFWLGLLISVGTMGILSLFMNFVNAIICIMYAAMIWLVSDFTLWILDKAFGLTFSPLYVGWLVVVLTVIALIFGWYLDHNVWKTEYTLKSSKVTKPLKIAMFADSHIGTTFDADGFAEHMKEIEKQNPDVVVVVGDYVDDGTSKNNMIASTKALGSMKTKYGVYFVFGNHDKGYYGAEHRGFSWVELVEELQKNGVNVLFDDTALINDEFYIIGRKDYSEEKENRRHRRSMEDIVKEMDMSKYSIVLDHQPADYENQAKSGVDLVLSGHTHGGQLFPFNQVGKWIKANDRVYGYERRAKTDFIVTSGISDWAIKFKTGTKSEYVIINVEPEK